MAFNKKRKVKYATISLDLRVPRFLDRVWYMHQPLSLSKQGVFGPRGYGRARLYQTLVEDEESAVDDESGVEPYTKGSGADAEAARYARRGLLVFLGGVIVVVMLLSSLLSAVLH